MHSSRRVVRQGAGLNKGFHPQEIPIHYTEIGRQAVLFLSLRDRSMRGRMASESDCLRNAPLLDRVLQEALRCSTIAVIAQEKIDGLPSPIHRAVEGDPLPCDPNGRLIASPRGPHWPAVVLPALRKFRDVPLDPAQNSGVGQLNMPLRHHFNHVSITALVRHVPTNTEGDALVVGFFEQL